MAKLTGKNALICGDDRRLNLTFDGIDLSGATVYFTVKTSDDTSTTDDSAIIQKQTSTHDDAANGITHIDLSGTDTRIDPDVYVFDIQLKDSSGKVSSCPRQQIEFVQDVTKRVS